MHPLEAPACLLAVADVGQGHKAPATVPGLARSQQYAVPNLTSKDTDQNLQSYREPQTCFPELPWKSITGAIKAESELA